MAAPVETASAATATPASQEAGPDERLQETPRERMKSPEEEQVEDRRRAVQAVRDITMPSTPRAGKESQMYDWDAQYDETLRLPLQLRNRVSEPGTPSVQDSLRVTGRDTAVSANYRQPNVTGISATEEPLRQRSIAKSTTRPL